MGMSLEQKQTVVSEITAKLGTAQAVIVAEYRGLDVGRITDLRAKARSSGVYLRVLKNTLARRAVTGTPFEKLADQMVGPLIYGISDDPVAAAKVISDFAKTNDKLVIRAGAYGGKALDLNGVKQLASIPSREVLLAQICGLLMSPISRAAVVLGALAAKKGGSDAAPAEAAPEAVAA